MNIREFVKVLLLVGFSSSMGVAAVAVMLGLIHRLCGPRCLGVLESVVEKSPDPASDLLLISVSSILFCLVCQWLWERL